MRRAGRKSIARTFDTRKEAEQWARKVELAIDDQRPTVLAEDLTVIQLLTEYRKMRADIGRPVDPTTNVHYMLQHLEDDLGGERVRELTPQRLAKWANARHKEGAGGYTVNMELSQLGTAIRHTGAYLQVTLPDVVGVARPLLHYGQLITGGGRRTRRPTEDELDRLLAWLDENRGVDVGDAVRVAAITGLRRGEMTRIAWADVDELRKAVLVRQRKHPRRVEARDEWVPLLGDVYRSIDSAVLFVKRCGESARPQVLPVLWPRKLIQLALRLLGERGFGCGWIAHAPLPSLITSGLVMPALLACLMSSCANSSASSPVMPIQATGFGKRSTTRPASTPTAKARAPASSAFNLPLRYSPSSCPIASRRAC